MKRLSVLMFVLALYVVSCRRGYVVLEREFMGGFTILDESEAKGSITISGYSQHSSLQVRECKVTAMNEVTKVVVYLAPYRTDTQGNFRVNVPVGKSTNEIVFGEKAVGVWRRR